MIHNWGLETEIQVSAAGLISTLCLIVSIAQGTELHEWERQRQQTQLSSSLRQKEEQLRSLRLGPRVTLGDIPEAEHLDKEVNTQKI